MAMDGGSEDSLYTVLGVAETATADEIKRAYYQLVRQVRPDADPKTYHTFQNAGVVLSDPRKRREYDQLRDAGRRVEVLTDQAAAAVASDPQKAFGLLKAAVEIAPDAPRPRLLLAHVLTRLNDFMGAEKQYRHLLKERPFDETLMYRFARCLFVQERYDDAERVLGGAVRLNPRYHDAHILLGRIYEKSGQFGAAIYALEKSIENDGAEDYADFDALLRLLTLHLRMENGAEAESTAQRIMAVLPAPNTPDPTRQCERAAKRMLDRARELVSEDAVITVRALAALGARLPNGTPETAQAFAEVSRDARLFAEAKHLQEDHLAPPALKRLAEGLYLNRNLPESERAARKREVTDALHEAVTTNAAKIQNVLEYIKREYPFFSAEQGALLSETAARAVRRLAINGESSSNMGNAADLPPGGIAPVESPEAALPASRKGFMGWFKGKK
ncbi:MAG: tetratricopeptide repeat protein [Armatimonadetes bacterium]|nr:tetratricopeptide repeat protein [Armatimonadota bacterium]